MGAPVIHHSPGRYHSLRKSLGVVYDRVLSSRLFKNSKIKGTARKPDNLEIVFCHNYKTKPLAVQSLEYLGIYDYTHLGSDIKEWKNILKLQLLFDHLQGSRAEYTLYLDSDDVVVNGDLSHIVDQFQSQFKCEVLFNAEKNSFPSTYENSFSSFNGTPKEHEIIRNYENFEKSKYDPPFSFLNSGCYIGKTAFLFKLLEEALKLKDLLPSLPKSDQAIFRELHRVFYPAVQIDHQRKIFQSLICIEHSEVIVDPPISRLEFFKEFIFEYAKRKAVRFKLS